LPWEKLHVFSDIETADDDHHPAQAAAPDSDRISDTYKTGRFRSRKLMADDTFADSLRHVNRLYTKLYGHEARKVPAHMPHFIQSDVMQALQDKFPEEFERTSSHKVRTADDMQYAFSYIYFVMNEKQELDIEAAFENLDTDKSGYVNNRIEF
jgi:UDP-N-acetylglucosamine-lysosomal-enzyme